MYKSYTNHVYMRLYWKWRQVGVILTECMDTKWSNAFVMTSFRYLTSTELSNCKCQNEIYYTPHIFHHHHHWALPHWICLYTWNCSDWKCPTCDLKSVGKHSQLHNVWICVYCMCVSHALIYIPVLTISVNSAGVSSMQLCMDTCPTVDNTHLSSPPALYIVRT